MPMTLLEYLTTAAVALFAAGSVYLLLKVLRQAAPDAVPILSSANSDLTYLFDGPMLVSATTPARRLLDTQGQEGSDWARLVRLLSDRFPSLADDAAALKPNMRVQLRALGTADLGLDLERGDHEIRISLVGKNSTDIAQHHVVMEREALQGELGHLRRIAVNAPQMIWQENAEGAVLWGNKPYLQYSDKMFADVAANETVWPAHRIFKDLTIPQGDADVAIRSRHSLRLNGEDSEHWFDVTSIPTKDGALHYASDANAAVRAEQSQKAFMQTLGQTFAHLSVGLAIFDRYRQLSTFNPALLELTGLPFSFLGSRPSLDAVLDRLREARKLPEPKDYGNWKEQFTTLESQAKEGSYVETWNLPDGQMLRVTGRPHPDGAIAFLFEDISAEISLTRRFRIEIETGQAVLDSLDDAIAVFSTSSTLVMMNDAYVDLWGANASDIQSNIDLRAALKVWKGKSAPTPVWRAIEEFAAAHGDRKAWSDSLVLLDGRSLECLAQPLAGGMTMVRFSPTGSKSRDIEDLNTSEPRLVALKR